MTEKISLIINIEGSEDSIRDVARLEDALSGIGQQMKDLKKDSTGTSTSLSDVKKELLSLKNSGKETSDEYKELSAQSKTLTDRLEGNKKAVEDLKVSQRLLREEKKEVNKELNKSIRDYQKFGDSIPDDSIEGLARAYSDMRKELRLVPKQIRDLADQFGKNEVALKRLDPELESAVRSYNELQKKAKDTKQEVLDFDQGINDFTSNIGNYASALDGLNLGGILGKIGQGALGFASGGVGGGLGALGLPSVSELKGIAGVLGPAGIVGTAIAATALASANYAIDVTREYEQLFATVGAITGLVGEDLQNVTARTKTLSEVFGQEFDRSLEIVNATQKGFGEDFNTTIDEITEGLISLGDSELARDNFLDSLREYPKLIADAGFSLREFIQLNVIAAQEGTYSDKVVDSVKEANLSLKELTKTQFDALESTLGNDFAADIEKRIREGTTSSKDAILEIGEALEEGGADLQDYAIISADVFKGAGEDSGGFKEVYEIVKESIVAANEEIGESQNAYERRLRTSIEATQDLNEEQTLLASQLAGLGTSFDSIGTKAKAFGTSLLNDVLLNFRALKKEFEDGNGLEGVGNFLANSFELIIPDSVEEYFGFAEEGAGGRKAGRETLAEIIAADAEALQEVNEGIAKDNEARSKAEELEIERKRKQAAATRALNKSIREEAQSNAAEIKKSEAEKRKVEKDAAAAEKKFEQDKEKAAANISKLENEIGDGQAKLLEKNLTDLEEYERQKAALVGDSETEIGKLLGDETQIAQQTELIKQALDIQIAELKKKREEALDSAADNTFQEAEAALNNDRTAEEFGAITDFNNEIGTDATNAERITAEKELYDELIRIEQEYLERREQLIENDPSLTDEERIAKLKEIAEREQQINEEKNQVLIDQEEKAAAERAQIQERSAAILGSAIEGIGSAIGSFIGDQEKDVKEFYKGLINVAIQALEQFLIASITAQSLAQPDSVATFGATAAPRIALLTGLVKAAFGIVRGAIAQFEEGGNTDPNNLTQAKDAFGLMWHMNNGGRISFPAKSGGLIQGPDHSNGGVKFRVKKGGRSFIGEARGNELIMNERQQSALESIAGKDIYKRIGIPGASSVSQNLANYYGGRSSGRSSGNYFQYEAGGFIPQVASAADFSSAMRGNMNLRISEEDSVRNAEIIAEAVGQKQTEVLQQTRDEMVEQFTTALDSVNRLRERESAAKSSAEI